MEPEKHRRVQRYGWDEAAAFYDESWQDQLKPAQDKILDLIHLQPGQVVLETSCGTGLVTFRAAKAVGKDGEIIATDLSDEMLEIARKEAKAQNLKNITFHRMDAEKLQFNEELFDKAICSLGLMYFPYPLKGLKEMYRLLKPGGTASVSTWGERKNCGWAGIFPIVDRQVTSDVCPLFFQQGTGDTLRNSFQEAGFQNIETNRFNVTMNYTDSDSALMAAFAGGPVALAYRNFNAETKEIVHREYLKSIEPYRNGSGYKVPGEFVVAKGSKQQFDSV